MLGGMKSVWDIARRWAPGVRGLGALAKEVTAETLWPTRCVLCDAPGALVCADCGKKLPVIDQWKACEQCGAPLGRVQCCECNDVRLGSFGFASFPLEGLRSVFAFTDDVGSIVRVWKDGGEQRLGAWMAAAMAACIDPSWLVHVPTVTAVPATKAALARRGFDHGAALAREVALRLDVPYAMLLERPSAHDQRDFGRAGRLSNVSGKFSVREHLMLPDTVLLVDDVCTTGSTLYGASRALKASGVRRVYGITFARVL